MGTAAGRHRARAPHRRARPAAHDLPLEGRRPRRRRAAGPIGASSLTLGGLLKHLAAGRGLHVHAPSCAASRSASRGTTIGWDGSDDWEFSSAADDTPEQLYALWDGAVARSRARLAAALADGGLDQLVHVAWPGRPPCQPAPAGLRPGRGVRPAHRARRPAPRGGRRAGRRGPAGRLAVADRLTRPARPRAGPGSRPARRRRPASARSPRAAGSPPPGRTGPRAAGRAPRPPRRG